MVSKATATRDLTETIDKYKLLERKGEVGAGTVYKIIGQQKLNSKTKSSLKWIAH